jgi:hypothetical protein
LEIKIKDEVSQELGNYSEEISDILPLFTLNLQKKVKYRP